MNFNNNFKVTQIKMEADRLLSIGYKIEWIRGNILRQIIQLELPQAARPAMPRKNKTI
jgi:hypothetical protein